MRFVAAVLVVCACGRLNFEGSGDALVEALSITSPPENAEVEGTAILTGTCVRGMPILIGGSGLAASPGATCDAGVFAAMIAFTDGDGAKLVTVTQGASTITRSFVRVTRAKLRGVAVATTGSAGFTIDCDLVIGVPPETVAGDLLLGMIYSDGGTNASISTPGFTRGMLAGGTYVAFHKIATASEPVAYSFRVVAGVGAADTCESAGVLTAWSDVDAAQPILAESGVVDSNDMLVVAPEVSVPGPALLVGVWGSNGPASGFTITGMTIANEARSPDDNANVLVAYEPVGAGKTGPRAATLAQTRGAAAGLFVIGGKP